VTGDLGRLIGDEHDAFGSNQCLERERVVDLHLGDVEREAVGNLCRQCLDGDLAGRLVEHAALLDTGRDVVAGQFDRNFGLDGLVEVDLLEVEVLEVATHRWCCCPDHDRHGLRTLDLEVEQRVALIQDHPGVAAFDLKAHGVITTE
jgi:hypothetical protein